MNGRFPILPLLAILGSTLACEVSTSGDRSLTESHLRVVKLHASPIGYPSGRLLWSPDGTRLVAVGRGIHLWDDPLDGVPRKVFDTSPLDIAWTADGRSLVFSRKVPDPSQPRQEISELYVFDVTTGALRKARTEPGVHFFKLIPLGDSTFAGIDGPGDVPSTPKFYDTSGEERSRKDALGFNLVWQADDGIWAMRAGATERTQIPVTGEVWWPALGSLHAERLALTIQVEAAARYVVMDYAAEVQHVLPYGFDANQWSADGRYLIGAELQDDGHVLTAGEVGLLDVETGRYVRLTATPKVIEWGIAWCEPTHRLAYSDERTGDVYIAELDGPR